MQPRSTSENAAEISQRREKLAAISQEVQSAFSTSLSKIAGESCLHPAYIFIPRLLFWWGSAEMGFRNYARIYLWQVERFHRHCLIVPHSVSHMGLELFAWILLMQIRSEQVQMLQEQKISRAEWMQRRHLTGTWTGYRKLRMPAISPRWSKQFDCKHIRVIAWGLA